MRWSSCRLEKSCLEFLRGQANSMLRACQLGDICRKKQRRSERFAEKEGLHSG